MFKVIDYIFHSNMIAFNSLFLRIDLSVFEDMVSVDSRVQRFRWPKVLWKESSLRQMGLTACKKPCKKLYGVVTSAMWCERTRALATCYKMTVAHWYEVVTLHHCGTKLNCFKNRGCGILHIYLKVFMPAAAMCITLCCGVARRHVERR